MILVRAKFSVLGNFSKFKYGKVSRLVKPKCGYKGIKIL